MSRASFFRLNEEEPFLGLLARSVGDGKKTLLGFKMCLQCSRGTLRAVVAGMEPLELTRKLFQIHRHLRGEKGAWNFNQEMRVCRNLHCWRGFWSSYWVQKAAKSGCKEARVVTGDGQLTVLPPLQWLRCWNVWFGEIIKNLDLAGVSVSQFGWGLFSSCHLDIWKRG